MQCRVELQQGQPALVLPGQVNGLPPKGSVQAVLGRRDAVTQLSPRGDPSKAHALWVAILNSGLSLRLLGPPTTR